MRTLWIAFVVVAALGSTYPFNFQAPELDAATVRAFLLSCCVMPGRGDLVRNVILFLPIGFTSMFATRLASPPGRRFLYVCSLGAIFALALQLLQICLPSRDENLQDVIWNSVGTAAGAALASLAERYSFGAKPGRQVVSLVPITLVGAWVAYRLIPFVPSLDFQQIKDSLKPLLSLQLEFVGIFHDFAAWIVVAYLLGHAQRASRLGNYLPLLVIAVFCLEVLIVANSITLSNVVGAFLAVLLWFSVLRFLQRPEGALVILLLGALTLSGLHPFVTRPSPAAFSWLPFRGLLRGSMYINAQSAIEKVFLYGSLVYLLWQTRIGRVSGIVIGVSIVTAIEFAQTRFVGHSPEITDPLLVLSAALALIALEKHELTSDVQGRTETPPDRPASTGGPAGAAKQGGLDNP